MVVLMKTEPPVFSFTLRPLGRSLRDLGAEHRGTAMAAEPSTRSGAERPLQRSQVGQRPTGMGRTILMAAGGFETVRLLEPHRAGRQFPGGLDGSTHCRRSARLI
jgi:hypothetical protein